MSIKPAPWPKHPGSATAQHMPVRFRTDSKISKTLPESGDLGQKERVILHGDEGKFIEHAIRDG